MVILIILPATKIVFQAAIKIVFQAATKFLFQAAPQVVSQAATKVVFQADPKIALQSAEKILFQAALKVSSWLNKSCLLQAAIKFVFQAATRFVRHTELCVQEKQIVRQKNVTQVDLNYLNMLQLYREAAPPYLTRTFQIHIAILIYIYCIGKKRP